jgi:hypothetical protein
VLRSQQQAAPTIDRLIPAPGARINLQDYPHTPYEKKSVDHSLHQAHLRSPKRILKDISSTIPFERHYQAVKDFALGPTPVSPQPYLYEFAFNIADAEFAQLTIDEKVWGEAAPVNRFTNGSLRFRIRCCNQPTVKGRIADSVWVTLETAWPDHIYMTLNNHVVTVKRKQHYSKDLPVEVSSLVQSGMNTLSLAIPAKNTQGRQQTPHIAVEIVEVLSHSAILHMVRDSGSRPATETRGVIRKRLAGILSDFAGDDNDLAIANEGISVDLADPFTATIFKVPVRGNSCIHLECFDLETWLNTRLGKRTICVCGDGSYCKCPKEPSFVDKWKCPLCDSDARPYSLHIDELLVEIRNQLEQNNQLRTKSITVYGDGSWKSNKPAEDDDSDINSDGEGTPAGTKPTSKASSKPPLLREVIELDDE